MVLFLFKVLIHPRAFLYLFPFCFTLSSFDNFPSMFFFFFKVLTFGLGASKAQLWVFFQEKTFIYLWKFSWACLYLPFFFLFFYSWGLFSIHGTAAHIHAWERLNTDAGFDCWPPCGSGGAAELSVSLKGTWTKTVTSSPRPGDGPRLVTLIQWSFL